MIKIWGKIVKKNKIVASHTIENSSAFSDKLALEAIYAICLKLDLPRPIVLNNHIRDINHFLIVRFLPDDFIEKVDFDRLEVDIFIEKEDK